MKRYRRWAAIALACLCLLVPACQKSPKQPENPLRGARWYTDTAFWTFFADGTFETRSQTAGTVETEGTYAFAFDGSGTLQCGGDEATIVFSDDRTEIQLAFRSGRTVVLQKSNPVQHEMSPSDTMDQLWVGDYENPDATVTISYCVQDLSVTYAIMGEAELLTGVWSTTDLTARTVSDARYTVTLYDDLSIELTVNPGYEDSDDARYAGTYRRYR